MSAAESDRLTELPFPLTPLVGREAETRALRHAFSEPDIRLITLTGPGGVGKTRLALWMAEELRHDFERAAFVPLEALRDPAHLIPTVAQSLGVPEVAPAPLLKRLGEVIGRGTCLLVLDNFEQIVQAAPELGALLAIAPGLSILVTSRSVLKIQGEHEFPVPPLPLPALDSRSASSLSSSEAGRFGAIALFVQRARAANPNFKLTNENAAAVAAICRRLDGLPLAIELAAARTRSLSVSALHALLERRLAVLTGGRRDHPERLRTMRQAIAWSYELLPPDEQRLFRSLSAFDGGFSLDDAVAIAGSEENPERKLDASDGISAFQAAPSVFDRIASLVEQSLVRRGEWPGDDDAPLARFSMLETIREFGLEQLAASGEEPGVRRLHAQQFLDLADRAEQHLAGPDERLWLEQLEVDARNIRSALDWLLKNDVEAALRLGAALLFFWYRTGRVAEGEEWLGRTLARRQDASKGAQAKALWVWGTLAGARGDYATAVERVNQALPLLAKGDDRAEEAMALTSLGIFTHYSGHPADAVGPLQQAQAMFSFARTTTAKHIGALSRSQLGIALHHLGDSDLGVRICAEVVSELKAMGASGILLPALTGLAAVYWDRGEVSRAATMWQESLAMAWAAGERWLAVDPICGLAAVAAERGTMRTALRLLGAVDTLCDAVGMTPLVGKALTAQIEAAAATNLPPETIVAERAAGAATPLAKVVIELLRDPVDLESQIARAGQLTRRERDVLRHLAEGRSDPEIAAALFVSRRTVATHVANLFKKIGVHSRAAASAYAVREGIA